MLTGFYLLENAAILSISKRDTHTGVGVGSNTVLDIMTVPVGGSIGLGNSNYLESKMTFIGCHVWAAQYRLLDIKYIKLDPEQDKVELPRHILLYPNIASRGVLRGTPGGTESDQAEISLVEEESSESVMQKHNSSEDKEDKEYNCVLEEEIQFIEEVLDDEA